MEGRELAFKYLSEKYPEESKIYPHRKNRWDKNIPYSKMVPTIAFYKIDNDIDKEIALLFDQCKADRSLKTDDLLKEKVRACFGID